MGGYLQPSGIQKPSVEKRDVQEPMGLSPLGQYFNSVAQEYKRSFGPPQRIPSDYLDGAASVYKRQQLLDGMML